MKRIMTSLATVAIVFATVSLAGTIGASAATSAVPSITISPSIGLTNNQEVTITGTGFAPNEASLVAVECNATATSVTGCNTSAPDPLTVSATGGFTSTFYVLTGTVGNGSCGTSAANAACVISIGSATTGALVAYSLFSFATGPGVAVSPSTNLANGQSVTITGSDFTPGDSVYAVECLETATSEAGCDTGTATPITVNSTGTLPSTSFSVVTGTVGTGTCGTSATNYDDCIIEVANIKGTDAGVASIDFVAPSITVAPAPKATRVDGFALVGRTVVISILGRDFTAGPKIIGHAGTAVTVLGHTSSRITVRVRVVASAKKGTYNFIIQFASGKRTSVHYSVK
jgi:Neocarzinostatin family